MEKNITLALIFGGRGLESEVSQRGEKNLRPIIEKKYKSLPVFIDRSGRWLAEGKEVFPYKGGFFCPDDARLIAVDCAFPLLHGDFGEDGVVQGALECADIPYIGCSSRVGAVCRDKAIVKAVAQSLGIPTLPYILFKEGDSINSVEEKIGYPMFVKPTCLGSSLGASPARDRNELKNALQKAFALSDRVIIERLLEPKRELECGYFSTKSKELFTIPGEILSGGNFYDYESKYEKGAFSVAERASVSERVERLVKDCSRKLVEFLGIRQISRIDFFLQGEDIYFNEINTMPGMTETSLYCKMLSSAGVDTAEMLDGLILDCLS